MSRRRVALRHVSGMLYVPLPAKTVITCSAAATSPLRSASPSRQAQSQRRTHQPRGLRLGPLPPPDHPPVGLDPGAQPGRDDTAWNPGRTKVLLSRGPQPAPGSRAGSEIAGR